VQAAVFLLTLADRDRDRDQEKKMAGKKYDQGKLRYDLIEPAFLKDLAAVLTMGAEKYEEDGWKHVPRLESRYQAALMRHFEKIRSGQEVDEESGLPHIAHVACNAMFLHWAANIALRHEYDETENLQRHECKSYPQDPESRESGPGCDDPDDDEEVRLLQVGLGQVITLLDNCGAHKSFRARLYDIRDYWDKQIAARSGNKTTHCEPDK